MNRFFTRRTYWPSPARRLSAAAGWPGSGDWRALVPHPAPPDEERERAEEPPLDRVEQVAHGGEPPASGSCSRVAGSSPSVPPFVAGSVGDDGVGAVEVLVDALDQVGDPQLREHVVGRVGVGLAGALGRLQPADQLGGTRRRRGYVVRARRPAAHDRERRPVRPADRQRRHHPVAVPAVVLAAGRPDRAVRHPGALDRRPAGRPGRPGTGRRARSRRPAGPARRGSGRGASAARRSCHASYCQPPEAPPPATTATSASRCAPQ